MTDKILDIPFENEFHLKLKDNEVILWENEVYSNWDFSNTELNKENLVFLGVLLYLSPLIIFVALPMIDMSMIIIWIPISVISLILIIVGLRKVSHRKHILTNQRLIFHLRQKNQSHILNILLTEIRTFNVLGGSIVIELYDQSIKKEYVPFLNKDYKKLTIINVENTPSFLKLIRQARLKAKGI